MRQTRRARVPAANGAAVEPRAPTKEIDMTARWKTLTAGLVLGGTLSACDVAPEAGPPGAKPDQAARPDEGAQIPNTVARLEVGTSTVFFAEPAPGVIIVGEKSRGEKVITGAMQQDPGTLWAALAQGRPMPPALQEALARSKQLRAQRPAAPAPAEVAAPVIDETSPDAPLDLGPDVLAAHIGGEQDPAAFIDYYCTRYAWAPTVSQGCWTNRTTSSNDLTPYWTSGGAYFARAAVASYRGSFRFIPEWRGYFYWSSLADLWTDPGVSWDWRIWRSVDFGFRYRLVSAAGDGFHHMRFVDDSPIDATGGGNYSIPVNR
jgi:hypothetical protein